MKAIRITCAAMFLISSLNMVSCKKECHGPNDHKKHHNCDHHNETTTSTSPTTTVGT